MVLQLNEANLYDAKKFRIMLKTPDANVSTFPIELPTAEQVEHRNLMEATEKFNRERAVGAQPEEEEGDDEEISFGVGRGIKNHVLPSTVPFGKIALDLNKLFYQNILSIKKRTGSSRGEKNRFYSNYLTESAKSIFINYFFSNY